MTRRVLALLIATLALGAASCPRRPDRAACASACDHLRELLHADRLAHGLPASPALDARRPEGTAAVAECTERCRAKGTEAHVRCLLESRSLEAWIACGGSH